MPTLSVVNRYFAIQPYPNLCLVIAGDGGSTIVNASTLLSKASWIGRKCMKGFPEQGLVFPPGTLESMIRALLGCNRRGALPEVVRREVAGEQEAE